MSNFKHFSPLQKLNAGLYQAKVFEGEPKINMFGGKRYHRFNACQDSFRDNLLALHYALRKIGEHYQLTYTKEDRLRRNKVIQNTILLAIDLELFFLKIKALLDCVAFFVPFYYIKPLQHKVWSFQTDVRDLKDPWAYRSMRNHFVDGKTIDKPFREILIRNDDWIEDVLWKRDLLSHKFHRISVDHDYWADVYYVFLYECNQKRAFIPDVLAYVSILYFKLVVFLQDIEDHFKNKCEKEISGYEYFHAGSSFSNRMDKVHYFFASHGKILDGKILIRIHPNGRNKIEPTLDKILTNLGSQCRKCKKAAFQIKPTVENFVLITARCACGNPIYLGNSVSKRFSPHFFDGNQNHWDLIPVYKLKEEETF